MLSHFRGVARPPPSAAAKLGCVSPSLTNAGPEGPASARSLPPRKGGASALHTLAVGSQAGTSWRTWLLTSARSSVTEVRIYPNLVRGGSCLPKTGLVPSCILKEMQEGRVSFLARVKMGVGFIRDVSGQYRPLVRAPLTADFDRNEFPRNRLRVEWCHHSSPDTTGVTQVVSRSMLQALRGFSYSIVREFEKQTSTGDIRLMSLCDKTKLLKVQALNCSDREVVLFGGGPPSSGERTIMRE
jgi:hypothetical protein